MNTYRLIALALLALSTALVLPFTAMDLYTLTVHKLDNYFLYMLATPAAVLSFFVVQAGVVVGFLKAWRSHVGRAGLWLIAVWAASMGFLSCRFLFA